MSKIQDIVRVTVKALGSTDDIEPATLLWQVMHTQGVNAGASHVADSRGNLGMLVKASAWEAVQGLFPLYSSGEIKAVLDSASRKGLVKMRSRSPYTFWVSMAGPAAKPTATVPKVVASRAERKVTPAEAGEDREPAPVTVTRTAGVSQGVKVGRELSPAFIAGRAAVRERQRQATQATVLDLLCENGPMQITEIAAVKGNSSAHEGLRRALDALMAEGLVATVKRGSVVWYYPSDQETPDPDTLNSLHHRRYLEKIEGAVRAAYRGGVDEISPRTVADHLGIKQVTAAVRDALSELADLGEIRRVSEEGPGKTALYQPRIRRRRTAIEQAAMQAEAEASVALDGETFSVDESEPVDEPETLEAMLARIPVAVDPAPVYLAPQDASRIAELEAENALLRRMLRAAMGE